MAVDVKVISFNIPTGAAGTTVTITPGFQTSAIFLVWTGRTETTNAGGSATHLRGYGLATASQFACVAARDLDGSGNANTDCCTRNDACIVQMNDGSMIGWADVQSINSTQVVFEVLSQFTIGFRVTAFCIGGLDNAEIVLTEPGGTGAATVTYNNVGNFQPNAALFIGSVQTTVPAVGVDSSLTFGAACLSDADATINNAVHWSGSNNASANMLAGRYANAQECFANHGTSPTTAPTNRGAVSAFNASPGGLSISWLARANSLLKVYCLMMKGGSWNIASFPTSTGTGQGSLTGMPVEPQGVIFVSSCSAEAIPGAAPLDHDECSIGLADGTDQFCHQASSRDANTTSFVQTYYRTDKIYVNVDPTTDAVEGEIALVSFNSDGYTIDQTDGDPVSSFVWALRVGDPVPAEILGDLTKTLGDLTVAATATVDIQGDSAVTLGALTTTATGAVEIQGASAVTLEALTSTATGTVADVSINGELDQALAALTVVSTGTVDIAGESSQTLGAVTSAATGTVEIQGAASPTLAALTSTATGTLEIQGAASITLDAVTSIGTGTSPISGALTQTLGALTLQSEGVVGDAPLEGSLTATLAALSLVSTGTADIAGVAAPTLENVALAAAGTVEVQGSAAITLADLVSTATGGVALSGELSVTLDPLSGVLEAGIEIQGVLAQTLEDLTVVPETLWQPVARPGGPYRSRFGGTRNSTQLRSSVTTTELVEV